VRRAYGGPAVSTHWSSHAQEAGVAFSKNQLGAALPPVRWRFKERRVLTNHNNKNRE